MVQKVDVVGYGTVEFDDNATKEEMESAIKRMMSEPKPSPATAAAAPTAPAPAQEVDLTKPAFVAPRQRATALQKRAEEVRAEEAKAIPFEQLYSDTNNLNKITQYATARFGKSGAPQPNETPEQYVNRFARHMRFLKTNELNYTSEQDWLNTAKPEDVRKAGEVYNLFEKTADFMSGKGQNPLRALGDYVAGTISAPSTALSLGVGKAVAGPVMSKLATEGLKKTVASRVGATAIGAPMATEVGTNVLQNVYEQRRGLVGAQATVDQMKEVLGQLSPEDQERFRPQVEQMEQEIGKGIDIGEAALTGAITAPISLVLETGPLLAAAKKPTKFLKSNEFTLNEILEARKKQLNIAKSPTELTGNKDADNIAVTTTNVYDGGDLLDEQGSPTALAQMQLKNSLDKQADQIAASIWKQMPDMAPKPDEKTFDAVQRTLDSFDKLPDNVIKQSLADAGTDLPNFLARLEAGGLDTDALQKFSAMYGVSTSDAARTLQSKSVIARMMNKMREIDPESAKAVDALLGKKDPTVGMLATAWNEFKRFDRNVITAMTTNMSTLFRNAMGTGWNATIGGVEEGIESFILNYGRHIAERQRGAPITGNIGQGIYESIEDAGEVIYWLQRQDLAKEFVDQALSNNPMLMSKLLATAEEMNNSDLYGWVKVLNTPAVLMDNYTRRAVTAASITTNMRAAGLDPFNVMAQGKNIPFSVQTEAVKDALEFTWSGMPTDPVGNSFVKLVEATRPLSTVAVPFARFMANATKWTLKHYNPGITATTGAIDIVKGMKQLREGDDTGQQLLRQGANKVAQQAVGAATLLGAIAYRAENQDTPWNVIPSDDGTTVDAKYLFPINVPLALGDFYYKAFVKGTPEDFKIADLVEALTGFKKVGVQSESVDLAVEAMTSMTNEILDAGSDDAALERLSRSWGDFVGKWLGRATVPLNQFSDIYSAFDRDEALPRDIYITKPGETLSFAETVGRNIVKGIPYAKQSLPVAQPATREEAPLREAGPLKQMTGLATIAPKNEIEAEIERLNIPYQSLFRTTGDKAVDAEARKFMAEHISTYVSGVMNTDLYKNATRGGQYRQLTEILGKLQTSAKTHAVNKSIQEFYAQGKVPPIEMKKWETVDPKLREDTIKLYKEQTGKSFNEDDNYMKYGIALKLANALKKAPLASQKSAEERQGYAAGGAVGKNILKKLGAKDIADKATDLLSQMQGAAAKTDVELPTTPAPKADVFNQMTDVLTGKPAPKPAATAKKQPLAAQTEQAIPAPTPKEEIAPEPIKAVDESVTPSTPTAFTDDDYALGEALMRESGYDDQAMKNWKATNFEDYMNTVHTFTGQAKGIKYKDMPPSPFKAKEIVDDDIEYDIDTGEEISVKGVPVSSKKTQEVKKVAEEPTYMVKEAREGDLNDLPQAGKSSYLGASDSTKRNSILSTIKEYRKDAFFDMRNNEAFDKFDDEVLGVLQGEYRYAKGKELDPADPASVKDAMGMAEMLQSRLDKLKEEYKDMPPVRLFHGQNQGNIENVRKGFKDPQKLAGIFHKELYVGAPSFTKDLNLNLRAEKFGGLDPENYIAVEIPYADYVFGRVNMRPADYDKRDLNSLARAISGYKFQARPVSLPRGQFGEQEDIFLDADKLKPKSGSAAATIDELVESKKAVLPDEIGDAIQKAKAAMTSAKTVKDMTAKEAYVAYNNIRDAADLIRNMSRNVQTYGGRGQQSSVRMEELIGGADPYEKLTSLANVLEDAGSKQKATALRRFARRIQVYNKSDKGLSDGDAMLRNEDATIQDQRKKRLNKVFEASEKLAKGGFVAKRR